jgi:hypothetical protein
VLDTGAKLVEGSRETVQTGATWMRWGITKVHWGTALARRPTQKLGANACVRQPPTAQCASLQPAAFESCARATCTLSPVAGAGSGGSQGRGGQPVRPPPHAFRLPPLACVH